jgi:hypothetical protein
MIPSGLHRRASMIVAILTVLAGAGLAEAATIYVSMSGNDAGDGSSWATAKLTVQAGLNTAVSGDQVWVAAGTYVECITLKDSVALYGGFVGNETDPSQRNWVTNRTVLDGNKAGSVVTGPSGATASTRIDGFTIRNGTGRLSIYRYGGGIYCSASSPAICNNVITGNTANFGGAVYCASSYATISDNTMTGNRSDFGYGGGIYCNASSPTISNNTMSENIANIGSGAGISCEYSTPKISGNMITENTTTGGGGGIFCLSCSPPISNNVIAQNTANDGGGVY